MPSAHARGASDRERGTGLLGTMVGFIIFLMFLFLAIHLLLHLYASSLTAGAAHDAAVKIASVRAEADRGAAEGQATAELRDALGAWGNDVDVDVSYGAAAVTVRVTGQAPSLMPASLASASGLTIEKAATVRLEEFRDAAP